jgi:hypothetical protein
MIHLARQLAHLFGESGDIGEWVEVSFLELGDPCVHPPLCIAE